MGRKKKVIIEPEVIENENVQSENIDIPIVNEAEASEIIEKTGIDSPDYEQSLEAIDKLIAAEKGEKRGRKTKEEKAKVAITIPGSLFVRMHNMVGCGAVAALDSWITKKNSITADLISLDEKTIQELASVAELAMKQMKIEENPVAAFYIMFTAGIATNYMQLKTMIKNAQKEDPNFDLSKLKK